MLLEVLCCLKTFLSVLSNTAHTALKYSLFHWCGKLRRYKGKVRDQVLLEKADNTMNDK